MSRSPSAWMHEAEKYTKNLKEKLVEIKSISGLSEQNSEITLAKSCFGLEGELGNLIKSKPDHAQCSLYLEECKELFKKLEDLDSEVSKKVNQEREKNKKSDTSSKKRKKYTCDECGTTKRGEWKYHKSKKDNLKFCSKHCFLQHYAETCDNCYEKCLKYSGEKAIGSADTYYSDLQNKTGVLCSKCYQEQLKELTEEKRKDKEREESFKRVDKNMDDLVNGLEEVAGKNQDDSEDREDDKNQESRIKNQESRIKNQE
ncbi:MAG: hypothetical protein I3275_02830, partial [Candidatus Moeniiplasma glomeromycotorum]|nr:hypothetical protein [Candidatus Moeniiplasma glomeromycotorum]